MFSLIGLAGFRSRAIQKTEMAGHVGQGGIGESIGCDVAQLDEMVIEIFDCSELELSGDILDDLCQAGIDLAGNTLVLTVGRFQSVQTMLAVQMNPFFDCTRREGFLPQWRIIKNSALEGRQI